jgi:hypothetical protein
MVTESWRDELCAGNFRGLDHELGDVGEQSALAEVDLFSDRGFSRREDRMNRENDLTLRKRVLLNHTTQAQKVVLPGKFEAILSGDAFENGITMRGYDVVVLRRA